MSICFLVFAAIAGAKTVSEDFQRVLREQGNPEFQGNEVHLLPSGREKYADMFATIRNAKRYVHLEYFILRKDSIGSALLRTLQEKVAEGVEVRILVDAYGNYKSQPPLDDDFVDSIRAQGIQIAFFDPLKFPWLPNMYHRDHRKIVVVDGRWAYTGGMNVADYYIHGTPRTGPWRDIQVRLGGPVVGEFERIFARIWERTTGERLDSVKYSPEPTDSVEGGTTITVVNREPGRLSRRMRRAYVAALDAARSEVRIVNPYPTSTHSVTRAMRRALRRGVRLRLMVSANMDNRITPEVVAIQMKKLMKRGAEVYYFEDGFHHSKTLTVDGQFCTIGTANLDGRSLRYDYEVNVFIFSPETTANINAIFDRDAKQSELLTPKNFKQRFSLKRRMVGRIFTPVKCVF